MMLNEQKFTRNVGALVAAVPGVLNSAEHDGTVDLDVLFDDAIRYFGTQRDAEQDMVGKIITVQ